MPFKKKKNPSGKLPPFVALTREMLNHPAYLKLPSTAAKALPYFLDKYRGMFWDPARHSMEFTFPCSEGRRYGFPGGTFQRAIEGLIAHGFIDLKAKGGLHGTNGITSRYSLSQRWKAFGTPQFIEAHLNMTEPPAEQRSMPKMGRDHPKNGEVKASSHPDRTPHLPKNGTVEAESA